MFIASSIYKLLKHQEDFFLSIVIKFKILIEGATLKKRVIENIYFLQSIKSCFSSEYLQLNKY